MGKRKGREDETTAILRRAMELQAASSSGSERSSAVADLAAAAKELGIEPTFVEQAAKEVRAERDAPGQAGFWGGPLVSEREIVFDGSVDDQNWEDVVQLLRSTYGIEGKCEQRGSTREWIGDNGGVDKVTATVRQDGGQLRVRITSRLEGLAALGYIFSTLPFLFVLVPVLKYMKGNPLSQWLIALAALATVIFIARWFISRTCGNRSRELSTTLSEIQDSLGARPSSLAAAPIAAETTETIQTST